jgi:cyanate permease
MGVMIHVAAVAVVGVLVPGNILEMSQKTVGLLVSPLFGVYFIALFVRFGTPFGAMFGAWYCEP